MLLGLEAPTPKKEAKPIKDISDKKKAKNQQEKEARAGEDTFLERWLKSRRKQMIGTCQCGCGEKSSKFDDINFRSSIAHIFPKRIFESVMYHPFNWVERNFWKGCHSNMDNRSMDLWPNMADWEDIKEKFYVLAPLLTDEERASKFYKQLEGLVYADTNHSNKTNSIEPFKIETMSEAKTKEEILALTCKKNIKIYKLSQLGLKNKEIADAVETNAGHVYNVLKDYSSKPEKATAAAEF